MLLLKGAVLMQEQEQQEPTEVIEIDGVGSIEVYGELDLEKLVKRLLQSESITK